MWGMVVVVAAVATGCGRVAFDDVVDGSTPAVSCPSFAVMCDDFETGDLSKWSAVQISPGGAAVVDRLDIHSGAFSLDATMPPGMNGANANTCQDIPSQSTGMLAMRAWISTPQPLVNYDTVLLFDNAGSCTTTNPLQYVGIGCDGNGTWVSAENSAAGLIDHHGPTCAAIGVWTCIELDYTFGAPSQIQIYVDDAIVIDDPATDPAPTYAQVFTGVVRADIGGYHVFVDDVVVARQHIGCQ